jgi:hypothetical protein
MAGTEVAPVRGPQAGRRGDTPSVAAATAQRSGVVVVLG